jgi:exonuclease SbcD
VHRFHPVEIARALIDLPVLSARGLTAADVDARIAESVEQCRGGIDGKIVRLLVRDIPRHIVREIDHRRLREYRRLALHFQLDTRRPEVIRLHGHAAPGRRPSIVDIVRDKLHSRLLEADIDRSALVDLGLRYLAEAEAVSAAAVASEGGGADG